MDIEVKKNDFKIRSFRSCISDAFKSTQKNSIPLMRKYWKFILAVCIVISALSTVLSRFSGGMLYVGIPFRPLPIVGCLLLLYFALLSLEGCILAYIVKANICKMVLRLLKTIPLQLIFLCVYVFLIILATLLYTQITKTPLSQTTLFTVVCLALLLLIPMFIISVPLFYALPRYMYEPESKLFAGFFQTYISGFKRWWLIFSTLFLAGLCTLIVEVTVLQPVHMLGIIKNISEYSTVSQGDEPSLPSSFVWLVAFFSFVATVIRVFILVFVNYAIWFVYGTIKLKNRSRQETANNLL